MTTGKNTLAFDRKCARRAKARVAGILRNLGTDAALRANTYATETMAFDRSSMRRTDVDGRLHVALAHISKACVNPYVGHEIPGWEKLGLERDKVYKLLRSPEELSRAETIQSANNIQLMSTHVAVTAKDPKEKQVAGSTGTDAAFNQPYLDNSLVVWRQEDIDDIESRERCELSCAYHYEPDMTSGNYDGENFDGVMRSIIFNHVALVSEGRAGPDVVVADSAISMEWEKLEQELLEFLQTS